MLNSSTSLSPSTSNTLLLIARILIAIIFIWAGFGKVMGYAGTVGYFTSLGIPVASVVTVLTIVVELGGGILILIGYQTRIVALILAIFTLLAALIAHTKFGDMNQAIHFTKNLAMAGGLLALIVAGAGAYSLDGRKSQT